MDSLVALTAPGLIRSVDSLAAHINSLSLSDQEKARFIYTWIARNIEYDIEGYHYLEIGKNTQW